MMKKPVKIIVALTVVVIMIYALIPTTANSSIPRPGESLSPLGGSRRIAPPKRPLALSNVLRLAKFDCQKKAELIAHVQGGAVVVEVGSFDGSEIRELAPLCRKAYTFEATPSKEERIRASIAEFPQVELFMKAVGDFNGTVKLYQPNGVNNPSSQQDSVSDQRFWSGDQTATIDVPIVRLDEVIFEHVDMIKVDTQGHEFAVLRGAERLISEYGIDILHLEFGPKHIAAAGDDPSLMLHWLHERGYFCMDCNVFFPPSHLEHRTFESFSKSFPPFNFGEGDHGGWTDLLCYQTYLRS